jgi:hypothetical protein
MVRREPAEEGKLTTEGGRRGGEGGGEGREEERRGRRGGEGGGEGWVHTSGAV